jgi:signal transduction histidine kinase
VKRSLRTRLIIGVIGGMLLLLSIFSLTVYAVIRRALTNQFDASLTSTARILAASAELDNGEFDLELEVQDMQEFRRAERPTYYQFWWHKGNAVVRSPSLGKNDLLRFEGPLDVPVFRALQRNGQPLRAIGLKFEPREVKKTKRDGDHKRNEYKQRARRQTFTLVVARDASDLYGQLRFLCWLLLIASAGIIILSFLVAVFVVRQGLNPLHSIASEISTISEDDLAARVGTTSVPAEILPIKNRLNDLLSRLEDAFKRERCLTADVTHELRTPLAGLRSTIEVTLTRNRNTTEYQTVLNECLAIVETMQTMVNNLLMIARLDARQLTFRREQSCLAELVNSCWRPFSEKAIEREITFDNRVPNDVTVNSDRKNLSVIFSNLLNNAVEYTNDAGQIWVTAHHTGDSVEIAVANTGCQLTDGQDAQVFDCFWRGDSSRTGTGVHCGLGLALVQRLVRALGGSVIVELQPGGIFSIRLTLHSPPI